MGSHFQNKPFCGRPLPGKFDQPMFFDFIFWQRSFGMPESVHILNK